MKRMLNPTKLKFSSCSLCQIMFETWENLGEHYANSKKVVIAEMNCGPKKNLKVCRSFDVDRYPTYVLFKNGEKEKTISGRKKKKDLIEYVENLIKESSITRDET